jgi:hypothetical protein
MFTFQRRQPPTTSHAFAAVATETRGREQTIGHSAPRSRGAGRARNTASQSPSESMPSVNEAWNDFLATISLVALVGLTLYLCLR